MIGHYLGCVAVSVLSDYLMHKPRMGRKMTERTHVKLLIVGSGPAGYTAAVYASRGHVPPS
jgi:alkyl hydroperoxide reductase subunit AhpF